MLAIVFKLQQLLVGCMAERFDKGCGGRNRSIHYSRQRILHGVAPINEVLHIGLGSEEIGLWLQESGDQHVCSCLNIQEERRCDEYKDRMDHHIGQGHNRDGVLTSIDHGGHE